MGIVPKVGNVFIRNETSPAAVRRKKECHPKDGTLSVSKKSFRPAEQVFRTL